MAKLNKVNVGVLDRDKSEFPLRHTVNTTSDFGHVQTLVSQYIPLGDTKVNCKVSNLTRVSPLVAPTFGEIRSINYSHFVPCSDVYPFFNQVLAGTPVYLSNEESLIGESSVVIENLPSVDNYALSLMLAYNMSVKVFYPTFKAGTGAQQGTWVFDGYRQLTRSEYETERRDILIDITSGAWSGDYALESPALNEFIDREFTYLEHDDSIVNGITEVIDTSHTPFNCEFACSFIRDIIPEGGTEPLVQDRVCFICFYHTRKSKTLWKHVIGNGYKPNYGVKDNYKVSIMPLLATAKAYFDIFQLVQYDNYYESILYKIYEYYSHNVPHFFLNEADQTNSEFPLLRGLLNYLSETDYVDDMDYLSSHQPLETYGDSLTKLPAMPTDVDINKVRYLNLPSIDGTNGVGFVDLQPAVNAESWLTHLDIQMLQKMYMWINRQSQCGYDIRNILVSRGYAEFVESCDSRYLGSDVNVIQIDDIMSMTDNYNDTTKTGKVLGERAGIATGGNKGNNVSFTANECGYFIVLNVVVPNTGYVGSIKPSILGFNKFNLYNPEFDGFGYEWSPSAIVGRVDQFYNTSGSIGDRPSYDKQAFGLIPRMSGFKIVSDVANGDMLNFEYRDSFSPYYMERIFSHTRLLGYKDSNGKFVIDSNASQAPNIPSAGKIWRKTVTEQFMGNYMRIFNDFDGLLSQNDYFGVPREDFYLPIDEFISHNYVDLTIWSRMLPIMDTFQTEEKEGEGKHITVSH